MREQITMHNFANTGGPVVNWVELNNSGGKVLTLASEINKPAIAGAVVVKSYEAKENDELNLKIGDLVSILDMPSANKSIWWRGKNKFEVGFFPSDNVRLIKGGSNFMNPNNLKQLLNEQQTGSLRVKESNNENENPLIYLLKCKQVTDDEKLSIHRTTVVEPKRIDKECFNSSDNYRKGNLVNKTDKKPLVECQTNSMNSNSKQNCTTPRINLRSISPLLNNTDHQNTNRTEQYSLLKSSTGNSTKHSSVFQRRNRISSTLPKSLTLTTNKQNCINLFNCNLNDSLDTTDKADLSKISSSDLQNSISSKVNNLTPTSSQPIDKMDKRSKLSNFLRSIIHRNSSNNESQFDKRSTLKRAEKSNVLISLRKNKKMLIKNTVFGCELNEYLNRTGRRIPLVLVKCCEFLEENGIVHGVYRLSGVNSNIQKLIKCFNSDESPDFNSDIFLQDVHCVSSLLKLYFRELPDPLLTFELYDNFVRAIQPSYDPTGLSCQTDELPEKTKLSNLIKVLKLLPLNHYLSLEYLVRHLNKIASYSDQTGMTIKNLAIVWSPNLLRSKALELQGGIGALQGIAIQAVLTEYLIRYADQLFIEESRPFNYFNNQEDNVNGSFLSDSQLNSFLSEGQNNYLKSESNQDDEYLETDENHFSDNQLSDNENNFKNYKFPIKQDTTLLPLPEAQIRWRNRCEELKNKNKTIDQLVSSSFKLKEEEDQNHFNDEKVCGEATNKENNSFFSEPCLNFNSPINSDDQAREQKEFERKEDEQPTFGVLGTFGSSRRRKKFGNLDLIDAKQPDELNFRETKGESSIRKRRSMFLNEELNELPVNEEMKEFDENSFKDNKFVNDRYRYKTFDQQSDEEFECKSNGSLKILNKIDYVDEPIQRYHTILTPKHLSKNKISMPKESNNLFKRTPTKWKPIKM